MTGQGPDPEAGYAPALGWREFFIAIMLSSAGVSILGLIGSYLLQTRLLWSVLSTPFFDNFTISSITSPIVALTALLCFPAVRLIFRPGFTFIRLCVTMAALHLLWITVLGYTLRYMFQENNFDMPVAKIAGIGSAGLVLGGVTWATLRIWQSRRARIYGPIDSRF